MQLEIEELSKSKDEANQVNSNIIDEFKHSNESLSKEIGLLREKANINEKNCMEAYEKNEALEDEKQNLQENYNCLQLSLSETRNVLKATMESSNITLTLLNEKERKIIKLLEENHQLKKLLSETKGVTNKSSSSQLEILNEKKIQIHQTTQIPSSTNRVNNNNNNNNNRDSFKDKLFGKVPSFRSKVRPSFSNNIVIEEHKLSTQYSIINKKDEEIYQLRRDVLNLESKLRELLKKKHR